MIQEIDGAAIATIRERVVMPGDAGYDRARAVRSGNVDRHPALIVHCSAAMDVRAAVRTAREQGLQVAVRSGGHSMAGFGTCDSGMVIDLSAMKGIEIDGERRVARLEPGLTWLEVARALGEYGLALTSGDMGSVGVGGLTLGGGIGFMTRKCGLTIDHLRSVRVVTAGGEEVEASPETNPDLFWALRGGGGNFGIATSFEFDVDPVPVVVGGIVAFDGEKAEEIVPAAIEYLNQAPNELTAIIFVAAIPPSSPVPSALHGKTAVAILPCYVGDPETGIEVVAPLLALGEPLLAHVGPLPYHALLTMLTEMGPPTGLPSHVRSGLVPHLDAAVAGNMLAAFREGGPATMLQLRVLGGAGSAVERDATAFSHRDQEGLVVAMAHWPPFIDAASYRAGVEKVWEAARPYVRGAYVGFLGDDAQERIHEAYPPDVYSRLTMIKRRYDPHNVFAFNTNVAP